jgi:hypothetical protein
VQALIQPEDKAMTTSSKKFVTIDAPLQIGSDRALLEQELETLRAEIGPHVTRSVAFFLAGCRHRDVDQDRAPRQRRLRPPL